MSKVGNKTKFYRYKECGLDNVWLAGIREDDDGDPIIPAITKLHNAIARELATKKSKLLGKEIRFLRTHMGLSGRDLAKKYLSVTPETLSRWENSESPDISVPTERLLRMMILKDLKDYNYDLSDFAVCSAQSEKLKMKIDGNNWDNAA